MKPAVEELKAFHHHEMIIFHRVAMMMSLDNQCQVCSVEGPSFSLFIIPYLASMHSGGKKAMLIPHEGTKI